MRRLQLVGIRYSVFSSPYLPAVRKLTECYVHGIHKLTHKMTLGSNTNDM